MSYAKKNPLLPEENAFRPVTAIGEEYGLTLNQVKKILTANGIADENGKPLEKSIEEGLAHIRMVRKKSFGFVSREERIEQKENKKLCAELGLEPEAPEMVECAMWNIEKLGDFFALPTEFDLFNAIKNKEMAEHNFCKLFIRAANKLSDIEITYHQLATDVPFCLEWAKKHELSVNMLDVLKQCYENDPYFIGGYKKFSFIKLREELDAIYQSADDMIQEMHSALVKFNESEAVFFMDSLQVIYNWMHKRLRVHPKWKD